MKVLLINKEDFEKQRNYVQNLSITVHSTQQVRARQLKELQWIKARSFKLNLSNTKLAIPVESILNRMAYWDAQNKEHRNNIDKLIINFGRKSQLNWALKIGDEVINEQIVIEDPRIVLKRVYDEEKHIYQNSQM